MKVFGSKLLDSNQERYPIDVDDVIFVSDDGMEIAISIFKAQVHGVIEMRAKDGVLVALPRAANAIQFETRR